MRDVPYIGPIPQPGKWFLMTYCDCGHVRKDHVDDGPCANIWEWPGALVGCADRCKRFTPMNRSMGIVW